MAASSTKWGNSAIGKTASGNMYAGHDGNVYKNTGNGWQKYDNGSWNSVNKPQPNWQGAESSQQRTGSENYQQRSSAASSDNRSSANAGDYDRSGASNSNRSEASVDRSGGGFDRSGSGAGDLDREAQNRSRGDFSSHCGKYPGELPVHLYQHREPRGGQCLDDDRLLIRNRG